MRKPGSRSSRAAPRSGKLSRASQWETISSTKRWPASGEPACDIRLYGRQLIKRLGGIFDSETFHGVAVFLLARLAASWVRSCTELRARPGSASRAAAAGTTSLRSQVSTALSRAASVRNPSRNTSLSVAYSPAATLGVLLWCQPKI